MARRWWERLGAGPRRGCGLPRRWRCCQRGRRCFSWGKKLAPRNFFATIRFCRIAGMFLHQPSGLYLTLNRAYDPFSGRWLSRDPAGEVGGINLYGYVDEDPINEWDEDGLAGHTKGTRPSTQGKHEAGDARRGMDQGGEKGDANRRCPSKRPPGTKGPWPPKPTPPAPPDPEPELPPDPTPFAPPPWAPYVPLLLLPFVGVPA